MIAFGKLEGCAVWRVEGVRSLFGELRGCNRCLGSWRGAIAVWS